jgi:AraC family transcriptional regulator, regulatory protein of adaptative response / methylated-DNA-[protein]-cysteine methyltransferase
VPVSRRGHIRYTNGRKGVAELVVAPASYGPKGRGAQIRYTVIDSLLGRVLVAATDVGICEVSLGASNEYLVDELSRDYPEAQIERADSAMKNWAKIVVDYIAARRSAVKLPVDLHATSFQLQVWKELCAIPRGATRSYQEIAKRVGRPRAARAVGHAIGSNPISVLIPCHRAVRLSGTLGGYRWGLQRKRKLLALERPATPKLKNPR